MATRRSPEAIARRRLKRRKNRFKPQKHRPPTKAVAVPKRPSKYTRWFDCNDAHRVMASNRRTAKRINEKVAFASPTTRFRVENGEPKLSPQVPHKCRKDLMINGKVVTHSLVMWHGVAVQRARPRNKLLYRAIGDIAYPKHLRKLSSGKYTPVYGSATGLRRIENIVAARAGGATELAMDERDYWRTNRAISNENARRKRMWK